MHAMPDQTRQPLSTIAYWHSDCYQSALVQVSLAQASTNCGLPPLGGVWWPSSTAATCHPKKATLALAEQAKQSGVNILEHTEVSDLNSHADNRKKWKVTYRILKDRLDDPEDHLTVCGSHSESKIALHTV